MKLGLYGATLGAMATPDAYELAQLAEELGYESLWSGEHMALPNPPAPGQHREPNHPFFDSIVAMSFLAARTTSIRLGLGILILPQHPPVQLAKELATLDILSKGRLLVGVGVGYLEAEYRAVGVDFPTRGARADEYLEALHTLWNDDPPRFKGHFVEIDGIDAYPRPISPGGPPILVGGQSPSALRRAMKHGRGWVGGPGRSPEEVAAIVGQLRTLAESQGRDPSQFEITAMTRLAPDPDVLARYTEAGADRLVITAEGETPKEVEEIIRRYAPAGDSPVSTA